MGDQLRMFEPEGPEVLALALAHEKSGNRALAIAESLDVRGWSASARVALQAAESSYRLAAEMFMLAEFEALAGVA